MILGKSDGGSRGVIRECSATLVVSECKANEYPNFRQVSALWGE